MSQKKSTKVSVSHIIYYKLCSTKKWTLLERSINQSLNFYKLYIHLKKKSVPVIDTKYAIKVSFKVCIPGEHMPRIVLCSAWIAKGKSAGFSIFRLICMGNKLDFFSVALQLVFNLI